MSGWVSYSEYCYQYVSTPASWNEARRTCQSLAPDDKQGDLASVSDRFNNWGYESWLEGEPNNGGSRGDQHYGTINHHGAGLWDDLQTTYHEPFFCQYDLGEKL